MRTTTTLSVFLFAIAAAAQSPGDTLSMYFDAPGEPLQLDSVYPAGCWQVGMPSKPVFSSAFSPGKALVTDTLLPHPPNTTCYAEFTLLATDFNYVGRTIQYKQRLDMDSTAVASVEVFDPFAQTWHRFGASMNYDEFLMINGGWTQDINGFAWTGQTAGWEDVWLEAPCLLVFWNEGEKGAKWYDPLMRLRFVFESQGNPNNRDGWMVDDVRGSVSLCTGSVQDEASASPSLYPIPADDLLNIAVPFAGQYALEIIAANGTVVQKHNSVRGNSTTIDIHVLDQGLYLARFTTATAVTTSRFVVEH